MKPNDLALLWSNGQHKKSLISIGKMCNIGEKSDLELRFKARFGGFERSGITLAVVSSTGVHGTAGRRLLKRGLYTFPCVF